MPSLRERDQTESGMRVDPIFGMWTLMGHRSRFRELVGFCLLGLALGCGNDVDACREPGERPGPLVQRIVLIAIDTLRADHIGAYGGSVPTPALDEIQREGVVVARAYTPTPSTGPAHVSLFTGLHPWNHGVLLNAVPLDDDDLPNMTSLIREEGFATGGFVSSFNLAPRWGFARGFDDYEFEPTRVKSFKGKQVGSSSHGEIATNAALKWLDAHRSDSFMLFVHYFDPHSPYEAQPGYRRADLPVDLEGKSLPPGIESFEELEELIREYRGDVAYTDAQIGRLIEWLRDAELLDGTAIVITADHGEGLGDHGWLGHGWNLFEELVRVPLLIWAPGVEGGRRLDGMAQLEDLMPTLLALAGAPIPDEVDGFNLLPWICGKEDRSPRTAVLGRRAALGDFALYFARIGQFKWIGDIESGGAAFDLEEDPREARSKPVPDVPSALRSSVFAGRVPERERVLDRESRRALKELGYLE